MRRNTQEKILLSAVTTAQKTAMERISDWDEITVFVSTGAGTTFPTVTFQGALQGYDSATPVVPASSASPTNRYVNLGFTDLESNVEIAGNTGIALVANSVKAFRIGVKGNKLALDAFFATLTGAFDCPTTLSWAGYSLE